jgi:hypothetical protein
MINVSIEGGQVQFTSSVLGAISEGLYAFEVVDETRVHLITDKHVHLLSVEQYTFNGQTFTDSVGAVDYIQTLNN